MPIIPVVLIFILELVLSIFLTGLVRNFAVSNKMIDLPSSRGLHDVPVPRGGGFAIAIIILLNLFLLWLLDYVQVLVSLAFLVGGMIVLITGLIDDVRTLPVTIKGASYFLAALLGVYAINFVSPGTGYEGILSVLIWAVIISWATNLYNFMDGSDGLAGVQAIMSGMVLALIAIFNGHEFLFMFMLSIVVSSSGFLFFNFPPARIFMGDSGSCFLGFVFGMSAYYCYLNNLIPPEVWLILFSVFISDTALTLVKRALSKSRLYEAHREHAYQRFILMYKGHRKLLFYFIAFFIMFLLPVSILTMTMKEYAWIFVIFCYVILVFIWSAIQYKFDRLYQAGRDV